LLGGIKAGVPVMGVAYLKLLCSGRPEFIFRHAIKVRPLGLQLLRYGDGPHSECYE
jgi:hypothetical protein